jgi:hypothetical protein
VSSAILYVAIVAIWIGVLVPRWLRHDTSRSGTTGLRRFSRHFGGSGEADDHERAGFDPEGRPRYTSFVPPVPTGHTPESHPESEIHHEEKVSSVVSGNRESMAQLYEADAPVSARNGSAGSGPARNGPAGDRPAGSYGPVRSYGWSAEEVTQHERIQRNSPRPAPAQDAAPGPGAPHTPRAPHAPQTSGGDPRAQDGDDERAAYYGDEAEEAERRAGMVRSRRRMLWMLVALTAVGIGLVVGHLSSWWIVIPPLVLLAGYMLLLREAAQADAEARERREAERDIADRVPPARPAEPTPATATGTGSGTGPASVATPYETGPRADIIDLSERVGDQLYDQYADAKLRAVGD